MVLGHVDVGDAAQRQRQRAALARARERLGLFGLQFERHGPADEGVLAFLFLRRLIDREHAHIGEDDLRMDDVGAACVGILFAPGEDDVDAVVRQDEAAGAGLRRDFGRDRAHAGRQDGGHEAGAVGPDQLRLADRLAGNEGRARDRAGDLFVGIGPAGRAG